MTSTGRDPGGSRRQPSRRFLVVWNRQAGSKAGVPTNRVDEEEIRRVMAEHGLGDSLRTPGSEAEAVETVESAVRDGYEVIVAAGGDGTAALVARGILETPAALGILPLGSAMNIARSVGIPRDLDRAAEIVATGRTAMIDVGVARGDRLFFEVASIGLSAELLGEAHRVDEREYGGLLGLVKAILRFRPHRIELRLDDRTIRTRAIMVAVANAPYTGLGLTLAPGARLDDGRLDVAVYGDFLRWELVRHLAALLAGRYRYSPKVRVFRAARVVVRAHHRLPVRADDVDLGHTPVEFGVRHAALRVLVPGQRDGPTPADS